MRQDNPLNINYAKKPIQGTVILTYNPTVAGNLATAAVTHNLGYTPAVLAYHYGSDVSNLANTNDPTLALIPLEYAALTWNGSSLVTAYQIYFQATSTQVLFSRLHGASSGSGSQKELIHYFIFPN